EKELGRLIVVEEMFKVTHVNKSTNPEEEERWIEPRAKETYDSFIRMFQEYRSTLPLESWDKSFTQEETDRERKREVEIAASKEAEYKRYATVQAQLTFLFESGNILPPCPASSDDGADQEGDENDMGDKESDSDNK
ncbi:hypothetical protein EJD97_003701, partial [Solanum chilense]